jgi:hypothetical protein
MCGLSPAVLSERGGWISLEPGCCLWEESFAAIVGVVLSSEVVDDESCERESRETEVRPARLGGMTLTFLRLTNSHTFQ